MSFFAGILTFLSPCILPLIPAYISFITGVSMDDLMSVGEKKGRMTGRIFLEMILFISGFRPGCQSLSKRISEDKEILKANLSSNRRIADSIWNSNLNWQISILNLIDIIEKW